MPMKKPEINALLWLLGIISLATLGFGMPQASAEQDSRVAKDAWMEEVLLQLSELRKAQGELRQQMQQLASEISAMRTGQQPRPASSFDLRDAAFPVLGSPDARIAIVEFSDFECPFCRRHQQNSLPALKQRYVDSGKLRYVFVDYPLGMHANAESAAVAGACAHRQGAFWGMHKALFERQNALGEAFYLGLATDLRLDRDSFEVCLNDPNTLAGVRSRARLAEQAGVQGTPAFLVGRVEEGILTQPNSITGAQPLQTFEVLLDSLLAGLGEAQ